MAAEGVGVRSPTPLIRLYAERMSLTALLQRLGDAMQADIYLVNPVEMELTDVHFHDLPAHRVLRSVLRGHSYAVVSRSQNAPGTVYFLGNVRGTPLGTSTDDRGVNAGGVNETASDTRYEEILKSPEARDEEALRRARTAYREEKLRNQIEELESQIASGQADVWYEAGVKIKGPKNIMHPRERLNLFLHELATLY
jgi:hypothetical protein